MTLHGIPAIYGATVTVDFVTASETQEFSTTVREWNDGDRVLVDSKGALTVDPQRVIVRIEVPEYAYQIEGSLTMKWGQLVAE